MSPRFTSSACFVWFSCPRDTPLAKRRATKFLRTLWLKLGATANGNKPRNDGGWVFCHKSPQDVRSLLLPILPPDSELRVFPVTESQNEKQSIHWGRMRKSADDLVECGAL